MLDLLLFSKIHTKTILAAEIKSLITMVENYIYSHSLLGPHSPLQSGFHISQEEIGWNSQHHSEHINERKSHNLKYRFIHLTNEAVYWWLIAVLYCWVTQCTGKNTLSTGTWPKPHTHTSNVSDRITQICRHTAVYTQLIHHIWPFQSNTGKKLGFFLELVKR